MRQLPDAILMPACNVCVGFRSFIQINHAHLEKSSYDMLDMISNILASEKYYHTLMASV